MRIAEYFESVAATRQFLLQELRRCDWSAGRFLVRLLEEKAFANTLGGEGKLFFLLDGNSVVSFLTLTAQDCIAAPDKTPWIGFVFTFPEYRGRHHIGTLLEHARKCAAQNGFPFVFLATDHVGLYEKYGFSYWGSRCDVHGEMSRIYTSPAADIIAIAEDAQKRAREVIRLSGIKEAWDDIGANVNLVGSLAMGLLMKHRDIDFHIYTDTLDTVTAFKAISQICATPNVTRLEFRNLATTDESCLEWHVWYNLNGKEWQIDMIQILKGAQFDGYFERVAERIKTVLTPETRRAILELKYLTPADEHIMGIDYYQAVIADGVRTYAQFSDWRATHSTNGINLWCP